MIDFQSPPVALWPCPSGTFENSRQHARVIHGWVHRPQLVPSPGGTTEALVHFADPKTVLSPTAAIRVDSQIRESERHLVCCSDVGRGEGELHRGRQPALIYAHSVQQFVLIRVKARFPFLKPFKRF
jgi:hypothetical protein